MPLILAALLAPLLLSCAAERDGGLFAPPEDGVPVVDALLFVDAPLPPVYLRRTLPPGSRYTQDEAALSGAEVALSSGDRRFIYTVDPDTAGRYLPPADAPIVQPQTLYRLHVEVDGQTIAAQTLTPRRLQLRQAVLLDAQTLEMRRPLKTFAEVGQAVYSENRLVYRDGLVEMRFDTQEAVAFQLALINLEEDSPFIIEADFLEEDDIADFDRYGASPPLDIADGRARLPWFAVAFAGRHLFKVLAIDQNWFDYVRSNPEESGGFAAGGLAGDNFERPVFNIEGGIGLFGSAAVDSVGFFILPRPTD